MAKKLAQILLILLLSIFLSPRIVSAQTSDFEFLNKSLNYAADVAVSGNLAYVAAGEDLIILNISDPTHPSQVGSYHAEGCSFLAIDLASDNSIVTQNYYSCRPSNTLYVVDVSKPDDPTQVGEPIDIAPGAGYEVLVSGNFAYVANGLGGLTMVDLTTKDVSSFKQEGINVQDVKVVGNIAYLADSNWKVWTVDITDKIHPVKLDTVNLPSYALGIAVNGDFAYISLGTYTSSGNGGLQIVNVADPGNIYTVEGGLVPMPYPEAAFDVEVSGKYAFVVDDRGRVAAFDISNPNAPTLADNYDVVSDGWKLTVSDDLVFSSGGFAGLKILRFKGLSSDIGIQLNVPLIKQTNSAWVSLEYDDMYRVQFPAGAEYCGRTIGQCGCAITSLTMDLLYYKVDNGPLGEVTSPVSLNNFFKSDSKSAICTIKINSEVKTYSGWASKGYFCEGVRWPVINQYTADAHKKNDGRTPIVEWVGINDYEPELIRNDIRAGNPALLRVPGRQHWVLATGFIDNSIFINDPYYDLFSLNNPRYGGQAIVAQRYQKVHTNLSTFEVGIVNPGELIITDPLGRRSGYDNVNHREMREIPSSTYFSDPYLTEDGLDIPVPKDDGISWLVINDPIVGEYQVEVLVQSGQPYSMVVYAADRNGALTLSPFFSRQFEQTQRYHFIYNPEPGQGTLSESVDVDIKPGSFPNKVLLNDKNGVIPVAILSTNIFDALRVDHTSVRLLGAMETHVDNKTGLLRRHEEDINGDGRMDMMIHFRIKDLIGANLSNVWVLSGETYDGLRFEGRDSVQMVK